VPATGADFELVDLPVPDPAANEVCVRGEACGICHSDAVVKEGTFPGLEYPRVPDHGVAGVVDAVGSDVSQWEGDRVGVGRHGGHCCALAVAGLLARGRGWEDGILVQSES
jgi:alcohol dehydrogenase/propanol-preferring alcohol dehydrogenase